MLQQATRQVARRKSRQAGGVTRGKRRARWWIMVVPAVLLLGVVGYMLMPSGSGGSVPKQSGTPATSRAGTPQPKSPAQAKRPDPSPSPAAEKSAGPGGGQPDATAALASLSHPSPPPQASPAPPVSPPAVEIGIAYGTEKRTWLEWAVQEFGTTEEGRRIRVHLIPMGSLEGAHAIVDGDKSIHVWSPASSLYRETFVRNWNAKQPTGDPIVKSENLALTPMAIVMWKERYDAFTARCPEVSLRTIKFALQATTGWGRIAGKPEWGHFKFGHTHPNQSNSGLMTLLMLGYEYHSKRSGLRVGDAMSLEFLEYLADFERAVTGLSNSTGNMMKEMVAKGPTGYDALMVYESVAIDFLKTAEGRWGPLYVVYPKYNLWNENPYYILNVPWSTPEHRKAAETFLKFLMSDPIQARALDHGFRPGNPKVPIRFPESPFVRYENNGLKIDLPQVCEVPPPEVIENLLLSWTRNAMPR